MKVILDLRKYSNPAPKALNIEGKVYAEGACELSDKFMKTNIAKNLVERGVIAIVKTPKKTTKTPPKNPPKDPPKDPLLNQLKDD